MFGVIQGLLSKVIASQEQRAIRAVEDAEGEHAAQTLRHFRSEFFVEMHEHFGIAVRAENVAFSFKLTAQLNVVVDFTIEDDADARVLIPNRLGATLDVNDAQSPHPHRQPERRFDMHAFAVRSTMHDEPEHTPELGACIGLGTIYKTGDSTHRSLFSRERANGSRLLFAT